MDKSKPQNAITEDQVNEIKQAFKLLDLDKDGHINAAEVKQMMEQLGIAVNDTHVQHIFNRLGKKGDGLITEEEFILLMNEFSSHNEDEIMEELLAAFRVFDKDGNGYITRDELRQAMELIGESVTDRALDEMLREADVDRDGRIDYSEFAKMLL
uniref:Calglandulin n=1 Tax=Hemiscolopendra marginata TaxID=943146 RepID=A0A646QDU6_9MYRI